MDLQKTESNIYTRALARILRHMLCGMEAASVLQLVKGGRIGWVLRAILGIVGSILGHAASALRVCSADRPSISYVVGPRNWSIYWDGAQICQGVNAIASGLSRPIRWPFHAAKGITHFGTQGLWADWHQHLSRSNRIVVTYFHGTAADSPEAARHIAIFRDTIDRIDCVVVANTLVEQRLIDWGGARRLIRIPIGVDTKRFNIPSADIRTAARQHFEIPDGRRVIGSFQKDGKGWGSGMEPKFIKGPDLFLDAVEHLARIFPIFVLLTGPARGFMMAGLEARGIPFTHRQFSHYFDIVTAYHATDLYLMTSREEGGPKAVIESAATGVPIVASRVGMAPDVIVNGRTGFLVDVGDTEAVVEHAASVLDNSALHDRIARAARAKVHAYDWGRVADAHYSQVYRPLLDLDNE